LNFVRKVWAIVAKDVVTEFHSREMVSAMLVFAVLATLVFSFALDLRGDVARAAAPGILWVTVAFAGTLGLNRSLAREQQAGCIDGLLLAPMDHSVIFFGKAIGNLVFMVVVEVMLLPLCAVLFDVPLLQAGMLVVMGLGTAGYAAVGTLLAGIAVNTRAREVMLPVLLLPLAVPVLIASVRAVDGLLQGGTLADVGSWVGLLVTYDLIVVAVSMLVFGYVLEE
jgi:heme exporter protein B